MWPFKKEKPIVYNRGGDLTWNPDEVEVIIEPKQQLYTISEILTDTWSVGQKSKPEPKPDTIESLINRLIELGEPKPEVVITGKKHADGKEFYALSIDGEVIYKTHPCYGGKLFDSLADVEERVIMLLNRAIREVVTETTTITY